jgi:hypothetical protein
MPLASPTFSMVICSASVQLSWRTLASMKTYTAMRATILLPILSIILAGCEVHDDQQPQGYLHEFSVNTCDSWQHHAIVDPYQNEGLFEITWDLHQLASDIEVNITLVDRYEDRVLTLFQRVYLVPNAGNLARTQAFHFDTWNRLWEIDSNGAFRYIGSLTDWDFYGRTMVLRLSACEDVGRCYQAEIPIEFW